MKKLFLLLITLALATSFISPRVGSSREN